MAIEAVVSAILDVLRVPISSAPGSPTVSVTVGAPNGGGAASDLVVFLYLITPDPDLRNADRIRPFPGSQDAPILLDPAVPLDLRFLVTVGAAGGTPSLQSFGRLADAIRALEAASPIAVPAAFQQAVWLSLLPMDTDELARIWGLFPNENCRSSFAFRASPVWIDPLVAPVRGAPVRTDSMRAGRVPEGV